MTEQGGRLRLGVLGLSEGNGHPYSWSAIFNGYDPVAMEQCGFPAIPAYLAQRRFPQDAIAEAQVTTVWAQDRKTAEHIARAALIPAVVDRPEDMIGRVDAVLLARDDAENHARMAAPFLDAGLPIYIDKPLALSVSEARQLYARQRFPGQLFSCSALRYAREFALSPQDVEHIGSLRYVQAMAPKDWDKYAVHVIEPLLLLVNAAVVDVHCRRHAGVTTLSIVFSNGVQASVTTLGSASAPLSLRVVGERGWQDLVFTDAFSAFRQALHEFVQGVLHRQTRIDPEFTTQVVGLIEAGRARE